MPRSPRVLLLAALALVPWISSCGDSLTAVLTSANMTWSLSDECADGYGVQARFFDQTSGRVWPESGRVYFASVGGTITVTLDCQRGNRVCYGATTDPETSGFWGLGIDGREGCSTCCVNCDDVRVTRGLTCN